MQWLRHLGKRLCPLFALLCYSHVTYLLCTLAKWIVYLRINLAIFDIGVIVVGNRRLKSANYLFSHINRVQMIKFTMGSSGNQKTHRRKPKRNTKSYTGYQNSVGGGGLCIPSTGLQSSVLPSSSMSATSAAMPSSCLASGDSSKLMFSPVLNMELIKWTNMRIALLSLFSPCIV